MNCPPLFFRFSFCLVFLQRDCALQPIRVRKNNITKTTMGTKTSTEKYGWKETDREPMWNDRDQFTPDILHAYTQTDVHLSASHSSCCILSFQRNTTHFFNLHTYTYIERTTNRKAKQKFGIFKQASIHTRFQVAGEVSVAHTNRSVHIQSSLVYYSFGWWSALRKSNLLVGKRSQ